MSLGAILDVIVALVFTYFLLALIASGVQEVVAGIFQWRGTYLSRGIDVILDGSSGAAFRWAGVRDFAISHFTRRLPPTPASPDPAFPPPGATAAQEAALAMQRVLAVQHHPLVRGSPTALPSYVSSRNFGMALLEALRDGSQLPLFSQAERTISLLPDGDLKRTLSLFLQDAGGDLDALRASIERWFDDAMDRLSGIYARVSQYMLIVLGLGLALAMNIDSVRLARTLWQQPGLGSHVAANATQLVAAQAGTVPGPAAGGVAGAPAPGGTAPPQAVGSTALPPAVGDTAASPQDTAATLRAQGLPIGWPVPAGLGFSGWIVTVGGWLFTGAAVALGAPFWFSLLQQLTNFRSAGPKPAPFTPGTSS